MKIKKSRTKKAYLVQFNLHLPAHNLKITTSNIMCTACFRTGGKASFDEKTRKVMAGGKLIQF
jgi:hypothetical protein